MIQTRRLFFRRALLLSCATGVFSACSDSATAPGSIAGTYNATTLRAVATGEDPIDLLAEGATMSVTIASDNTTTGAILVPASVTGESSDFTMSMAGTAVRTGNTVRFQQNADTFVRELTFTVNGTTLQASNQSIGGVVWTVTLTRQ